MFNMNEMSEVALYSFNYYIGEYRYEGEIPALSFEDAQDKVQRFGGVVDGRIDRYLPTPYTKEHWPEEL